MRDVVVAASHASRIRSEATHEMKHPSYEGSCGVCRANAAGNALFENELWCIRRLPAGVGVPGWLMLNSQRHVPGIAHFDEQEAANFGPALRHFERVLEEGSGARRICPAALGE